MLGFLFPANAEGLRRGPAGRLDLPAGRPRPMSERLQLRVTRPFTLCSSRQAQHPLGDDPGQRMLRPSPREVQIPRQRPL